VTGRPAGRPPKAPEDRRQLRSIRFSDREWAVVVAAALMILTAGPIGDFVERHPTIKMLALSFLLLIGFTLIVEGLHQHIPKGYIYFAMAFSVFVEMLNLKVRGRAGAPVRLRGRLPS